MRGRIHHERPLPPDLVRLPRGPGVRALPGLYESGVPGRLRRAPGRETAQFRRALAASAPGRDEFREHWIADTGDGGIHSVPDAHKRDALLDDDGVAAEVIFPDADVLGLGGVDSSPFGSGLGSSGEQRRRAGDGGRAGAQPLAGRPLRRQPRPAWRRGVRSGSPRPGSSRRGDQVGGRPRAQGRHHDPAHLGTVPRVQQRSLRPCLGRVRRVRHDDPHPFRRWVRRHPGRAGRDRDHGVGVVVHARATRSG